MQREIHSHLGVVKSISPAAQTSDADGDGVDLSNFDSSMVVFSVGTITDGTHTPKLQESDDDVTYTDVSSDDLVGSLSALSSDSPQKVGYKGYKKYVKAFVTVAGASTGGVYGAEVVKGHAHAKPVA